MSLTHASDFIKYRLKVKIHFSIERQTGIIT